MDADFGQMIINVSANITAAAWKFLWAVSALVGTIYCGSALIKAHRASLHPGQGAQFGPSQFAALVIIAALLANLSTFINRAWNTIAPGEVDYGPIAYAPATQLGQLGPVINACMTLVSVAGGFFALRGLLLWKKAALGGHSSHGVEDNIWRGLTHVMCGAAMVQIPQLIDAARQTIGLMG